jgi:hypothetical protein
MRIILDKIRLAEANALSYFDEEKKGFIDLTPGSETPGRPETRKHKIIKTIKTFYIGIFWRYDTQHNDIQHNDIQHKYSQHNNKLNATFSKMALVLLC